MVAVAVLLTLFPGSTGEYSYVVPDYTSIPDLVLPEGYPLEEHAVTTNDGYILTVYRLPHGKETEASAHHARRPAVLLQHGLLDSCAAWLFNGPNHSLGFMLADAGYDVWLGNSRGNTYSSKHVRLSAEDPAFWQFSFDEMAEFDLPAIVDYIQERTGMEKIAYVGHSQGSTTAFAALSSNADLSSHISIGVMLGPVAFASHITNPFMGSLARMNTDQIVTALGVRQFLPNNRTLSRALSTLCATQPQYCSSVMKVICGYNEENVDYKHLPIIIMYEPAGTSAQNVAHWAQGVRETLPVFQKFDYGTRCTTVLGQPRMCNQRKYGSETPPAYDLGRISVPIALFTGGLDQLADEADAVLLVQALRESILVFSDNEPSYEHLDFVWGINAPERIYGKVMTLLEQHSKHPGEGSTGNVRGALTAAL